MDRHVLSIPLGRNRFVEQPLYVFQEPKLSTKKWFLFFRVIEWSDTKVVFYDIYDIGYVLKELVERRKRLDISILTVDSECKIKEELKLKGCVIKGIDFGHSLHDEGRVPLITLTLSPRGGVKIERY